MNYDLSMITTKNRNQLLKEFQLLVQHLERKIKLLEARSLTYSNYRLLIFALGAVLAFVSYYWISHLLALVLFLLALAGFVYTVNIHQRIENSLATHKIWQSIKKLHLAQMRLKWDEIPSPRTKSSSLTGHPFENDLDITGQRSLLHLVDTTVTSEANLRLKGWLLKTKPDLQTIFQRQRLVQELIPLARFRDKLRLHLTLMTKNAFNFDALLNWLERPSPLKSITTSLIVLSFLALVNAVLFIAFFLHLIPAYGSVTFLVYVVIFLYRSSIVKDTLADVLSLNIQLQRLKAVAILIENYPLDHQKCLLRVCRYFHQQVQKPSVKIKEVQWILSAIGLRMNPLVYIILNSVVPWEFYFIKKFEEFKLEIKDLLPLWLDTIFELEALSSLANFAYLNPDYHFPQITEMITQNPVLFEAKQVGHPLLPHEQKICNDFKLSNVGEIALITGSNMAGKSTFLRTIGINHCLAYAGTVVNAAEFKTQMFNLVTCIKINDSVTEGFSYFYAEVKRLKFILDQLTNGKQKNDQTAVLFLIDEIFKGTNNRERHIGAKAYIQSLSGKFGLGLVTTHDLDLVHLEEDVSGLHNYHFRETVEDGLMVFDYLIHAGPCPTTNALKIMQLEGLPVPVE